MNTTTVTTAAETARRTYLASLAERWMHLPDFDACIYSGPYADNDRPSGTVPVHCDACDLALTVTNDEYDDAADAHNTGSLVSYLCESCNDEFLDRVSRATITDRFEDLTVVIEHLERIRIDDMEDMIPVDGLFRAIAVQNVQAALCAVNGLCQVLSAVRGDHDL